MYSTNFIVSSFFLLIVIMWEYLYIIIDISPNVLLIIGILINMHMIKKYFNHKPFLIINIFQFFYLLYLIPYYFFNIYISDYFEYQGKEYINDVLLIHVLFLALLNFFIKSSIYKPISKSFIKIKSNVLFYFISSIIFLSSIFLVHGDNIFLSSNTYVTYINNLRNNSGMVEYLLILFAILYIYTNNKVQHYIFNIIFLIIIYKMFILGFRVQLLMYIILYYLLYIDARIKSIYVLYISIIGFSLMSIIGILKDAGKINLMKIFFNINDGFILSHHTGVIYSSSVYIGLLKDNIVDTFTVFFGGIGFLLNMIIPGRFIKEYIPEGQIHSFAKELANYGGGGLPEVIIYYYYSFIGVIVFAYLFSRVINYSNISKTNSNVKSLVVLIILVTFPRWLSYDPANFFFRLPLYALILYMLTKIIPRRNNVKKNINN
jgi:hypothetical protein